MKNRPLYKLMLTCIGLLLWLVCPAQKHTPDNLPLDRIHFGSTGGFAGSTEEYTLLKNGQLFYFNSLTKEKKELKSIPAKKAKNLFKKLKKLKLAQYNIHSPGNMTYFLREVKAGKIISAEWSKKEQLPQPVLQYYEKLNSLLKTSS